MPALALLLFPLILAAGAAGVPESRPAGDLPAQQAREQPGYRPPGLAIAEHNGCLGCHSVDRKRVGPSFHSIAMRYRDVPDAEDRLYEKVKHGGKGAWGAQLAMPHHMAVKDQDIRTLVRWILAQP